MKTSYLVIGLVLGCLSFAGAAQAATSVTFTGGQSCACNDGDNWADIFTPSTVTLTCGSAAQSWHDGVVGSFIREYSCSTFPGAVGVIGDNVSRKILVSYIDRACPQGYAPAAITQPSTTAGGKSTTISKGYCAKVVTPKKK